MENSVTFKPVLWRLIIWKFVPFYIGWMIGELIYEKINHYNSALPVLVTALAVLAGTTISTFLFHKKFNIVIREGNITGLGIGWFLPRETISITNLDFSYRDKQSFHEKISFFRTIHSLSGQKILVADFIYGTPVTREIYKILEQDHLQFNKL